MGRKWESKGGVSEYICVVCLTGAYMAVYCCVAAACVSLHSRGCQLLFYFKALHEPESNTSCVPAYLRDAGKDASAFAAAQSSTILGRLPGGVYRFSNTATARVLLLDRRLHAGLRQTTLGEWQMERIAAAQATALAWWGLMHFTCGAEAQWLLVLERVSPIQYDYNSAVATWLVLCQHG